MRCSHILHRVDDLHAAVRAFQQVGFTVVYGRRPGRSSNALIWFETGPFLELVQVPRLSPPRRWAVQVYGGRGMRRRVERWVEWDRSWIDVALETDDESIGAERDRLVAAGVPMSRTLTMRRVTPDGVTLRWQLAAPQDPSLPFAMSAYRPPARPEQVVHANGATAVARVHVAVPSATRAAWQSLLDGEDPWIRLEDGDGDGVRLVELSGLTTPLDLKLIGGLPLRPVGSP
ncbi:VOC family protein [Salinispora arenicola]|uniref:VOC family protein n=1 Tax=Salinispora arenicola TaxID=168697 RepID=UPI0003616C79|nr:VOC family protein [Salinispora arenicola]